MSNKFEVRDMNGWLQPPNGFELIRIAATGSYLRLTYRTYLYKEGTTIKTKISITDIYLNTEGREVIRTKQIESISDETKPEVSAYKDESPLRWYEKIEEWLRRIFLGEQDEPESN